MEINKQTLKNFREDFKEVVKALEEKHNCKVELGNISYGEDRFTSKVTVLDASVSKEDREKTEFEKYCGAFGFEKSDYLKEVTINGEVHELYGFKTKASKNTCKIRSKSSGQQYVCPKTTITSNSK